MARSRQLKPDFFLNEHLALLPALTRLAFMGLWLLADREGRLEDRPARIKAQLFPYHEADLEAILASLAPAWIERYEAEGQRLIQIVNFKKHQHVHPDEKKSVIPAPPGIPGDPRRSPEIMPCSSSPSSSTSPSSKTTAPPAIDLTKGPLEQMEKRRIEAGLFESRLPFGFGEPGPDRFEKGTRIQDLGVKTCKAILEMMPRIGKDTAAYLRARIAQIEQQRERA
jgi:hypothetical protein